MSLRALSAQATHSHHSTKDCLHSLSHTDKTSAGKRLLLFIAYFNPAGWFNDFKNIPITREEFFIKKK